MRVRLTRYEVQLGAQIGVARRIEAIALDLKDRNGFSGDSWGANIEGALGEMAVAKGLGRYFDATVNTFKSGGDIGPYQVRTRPHEAFELIVREDDREGDVFILVTGSAPFYDIKGWILGRDARRDDWWKGFGNKPKAWFVPLENLNALETLPAPALVTGP